MKFKHVVFVPKSELRRRPTESEMISIGGYPLYSAWGDTASGVTWNAFFENHREATLHVYIDDEMDQIDAMRDAIADCSKLGSAGDKVTKLDRFRISVSDSAKDLQRAKSLSSAIAEIENILAATIAIANELGIDIKKIAPHLPDGNEKYKRQLTRAEVLETLDTDLAYEDKMMGRG